MDSSFFVSYAKEDRPLVSALIEKIQNEDLQFWMDYQNLNPGMNWAVEISNALRNSKGVVFFASESSISSSWVMEELRAAFDNGYLVINILITPTSRIDFSKYPFFDQQEFMLDISGFLPDLDRAAESLSQFFEQILDQAKPRSNFPMVGEIVSRISKQVQDRMDVDEARPDKLSPPTSVFIVHGHDIELLKEVKDYLVSVNVEPVVLREIDSRHQTLIQKFYEFGKKAFYAIILISPDDLGSSVTEYKDPLGKDRALQFRARQNVILELGFFYGLLGFQNVFILYKKPTQAIPRFERPSDIDGVMFEEVDALGDWKRKLKSRLQESGFVLS